MSKRNFLIMIRDDSHRSSNIRHITVYAEDEDHAQSMGEVAAEAMYEDYHEAPTYYVEQVVPLE